MRAAFFATLLSCVVPLAFAQNASRTLVAVFAHDDDEVSVGPILARYAREGVDVYVILATDGAQGGANTTIPRGPELARARAEEARCAASALGIHPPILLGFPDGALGNYTADPALVFRLTQRLQEELQRLHPNVVITFGPDGAVGHPDHRIVGSVVTQLVRAGAPGFPEAERLFYAFIPAEGIQVMNPGRGAPPFLIPQPKYLNARISFSAADFDAARRSMMCHKSQYSDDVVQRVSEAMRTVFNGILPLSSLASSTQNDLFR